MARRKPYQIASSRLGTAIDSLLSKNALIDLVVIAATEQWRDSHKPNPAPEPTDEQLAKVIERWCATGEAAWKRGPVELQTFMVRQDQILAAMRLAIRRNAKD